MIGSEALPATDRLRGLGGGRELTWRRAADIARLLLSRLLLALFLAGVAVLIPGEATRVLEMQSLNWSDLLDRHPRG